MFSLFNHLPTSLPCQPKKDIIMAPRSDNISKINPVKESWSIVVPIVRDWFVCDVNRDTHLFSLDMVLMDASVSMLHFFLAFC